MIPSAPLPAGWNTIAFNAGSWPTGQLGIGYGDGDDLTAITGPVNSVYVRKTFSVSNASAVVKAYLDIDYDDGFVAYLNGTVIARSGIGPAVPDWDTPASDHEAE